MSDKQSAYEWRRKMRRIGFCIDGIKSRLLLLADDLVSEDYLLERRYLIENVEDLRKEALDKVREMEQALLQVGSIYANLIPTAKELNDAGTDRLGLNDQGRNDKQS